MNRLSKIIFCLSLIELCNLTAFAPIRFTDTSQEIGDDFNMFVQLGDIDGDGDLDALEGGDIIRVRLNDGTGHFVLNQTIVGNNLALADFDKDGDLDLFVTNYNPQDPNGNGVWLNDGTGLFTNTAQQLGKRDSRGIALGDLDGDGDIDAFVANHTNVDTERDGGNQVFFNDGAGQFTDSGQELGNDWSNSVVLGDIDNDGDLDAVVANNPFKYKRGHEIWINDGTGGFTLNNQTISTTFSSKIALGDIDNDNDLDMFVVHEDLQSHEQGNIILFNDGEGNFTDSGQLFDVKNSHGICLGDLDGDGDLDAYIANVGDWTAAGPGPAPDDIWFNDGTGHTQAVIALENAKSMDIQLGDLDGDNDLDAYVACAGPNKVWLNQSTLELKLDYCTYIGGSQPEDGGAFLNLDGQGRAYVVLNTASSNCPTTPNAFDRTYNGGSLGGYGGDIYAAKLSEDGGSLDYGTYIGGTGHEFHSYFSAVDRTGHLCVFGMTRSTNFPTTTNAFDRTFNSTPGSDNPDVFLFRLDPSTGHPVWSTYIGGRNWEAASAIALGPDGSVYVLGCTNSPDFPTTQGCYDSVYTNGYEMFVCKFTASGVLEYSTLLGITDSFRFAQGDIAVDAQGCAWIVKSIGSPRLPVTDDALDRTYNGGDSDIYLMKLNAQANDIVYRTYLGGSGSDSGTVTGTIDIADDGTLLITGETTSPDFPVTDDAFDSTYTGPGRSFWTKLSPDGTQLEFSTFLNGSPIGSLGENLVILKGTNSADLPRTQRLMDVPFNGNNNLHLSIVNPITGRLLYGAYIGGSGDDYCITAHIGSDSSIWLGGGTNSPDLPTTQDALTPRHNNVNSTDGYVMKLSFKN
jgi:hypothetical protein